MEALSSCSRDRLEKHLLQLSLITDNIINAFCNINGNGNGPVLRLLAKKAQHLGDYFIQVDSSDTGIRLTGKTQQPAGNS